MRMDVEAEAAAAILDAGAAAARRSIQQQKQQHQQHKEQAVQAEVRLQLKDASVQTEQQQQQQEEADAVQVKVHAAALEPQAETCGKEQHLQLDAGLRQAAGHQQPNRMGAGAAERPATPQPAAAPPAAATAGDGNKTAAAAAAVAGLTTALPAATDTPTRTFIHNWQAAAAAGDDDMCRMSSASDTPASISRMNSSRVTLGLPLGSAVAAADSPGSTAPGSTSGEYVDCGSTGSTSDDNGGAGSIARPDSACTTAGLPELTTAASPVAPSTRVQQQKHQRCTGPEQSQQVQPPPLEQQKQQEIPALQIHHQRQQPQQPDPQDSTTAQLSDWHVELLQQQAQLDLLKMRLSQQQKQQRLHNLHTGLGRQYTPGKPPGSTAAAASSSSSAVGGRSSYSPLGATAGAHLSRGFTAAATGGAAGIAADSCSAVQAAAPAAHPLREVPGSPLAPAAGGSSPMTLQQRRQQQAAVRAAADGSLWGGPSRLDQQQQLDQGLGKQLSSSGLPSGVAGEVQPGSTSPPVQQQYSRQERRYNSNVWQTTDNPTFQPTERLYTQMLRVGQGREGSSSGIGESAAATAIATAGVTASEAGSSNGSSSSGVGAGSGLVQLGNDVMGALSLSRYHRERSKEQEARAKQHALNAQDALDRAAAVRISRLSSTSPSTGTGSVTAGVGTGAVAAAGAGRSPAAKVSFLTGNIGL